MSYRHDIDTLAGAVDLLNESGKSTAEALRILRDWNKILSERIDVLELRVAALAVTMKEQD